MSLNCVHFYIKKGRLAIIHGNSDLTSRNKTKIYIERMSSTMEQIMTAI